MGREHTDTWFFWGDSVTLGVNDNEVIGGWVSRLVKKGFEQGLYELPPATFYNLGARRQTFAQIAARIESEYSLRLIPGTRSRFALCAGTVDALQGKKGPDEMNKEFASLIVKMNEIAPTLFICPPPLANDEANLRLSVFCGLAENICKTLNVPCINLGEDLAKNHFRSLLTDGIHPGPEGNELFANLLASRPEMATFLER